MDDSSARVDPDAVFLLCEEYPVWFAEAAARWRIQRPEKCLGNSRSDLELPVAPDFNSSAGSRRTLEAGFAGVRTASSY